jgi:hypothetical protein
MKDALLPGPAETPGSPVYTRNAADVYQKILKANGGNSAAADLAMKKLQVSPSTAGAGQRSTADERAAVALLGEGAGRDGRVRGKPRRGYARQHVRRIGLETTNALGAC